MMHDFQFIVQWWLVFFVIGIIFLPFTSLVFDKFVDRGYAFSKVLGLGIISYLIFVLSVAHILPFNIFSIIFLLWGALFINFYILKKRPKNFLKSLNWKIFIFEEILFFAGITFWAYVRGHEPSINGLEKFMDFGFLNSILRSNFFPPTDMWFSPLPINYYYFGHLSTAVVTKISLLPSFITYNLMIATLFSFCATLSFSLAINLISHTHLNKKSFVGGIITALFITFGGNLHTIYALFKPYNTDSPVPVWNLPLLLQSIPNTYWYPNATRFIPFTIHEFPLYSFVVSDLHGHVLDIMYVLLVIAMIYSLFIQKGVNKFLLALISFFLAIMYMTNVWDGAIYLLILLTILFIKNLYLLRSTKGKFSLSSISFERIKIFVFELTKLVAIAVVLFFIFTLPFNIFFKPFASGIGLLCAPKFLTDIGHIGPLLFETNHCQRTPFWQLSILYGAFYFFVISFLVFLARQRKDKNFVILKQDIFVLVLIIIATFLIIVPEIIYLKDIYPQHYRANTMFKLVYESFMLLSIASVYSIVRIMTKTRNILFYTACVLIFIPVFTYPYFAIKSYYGDLKNYSGIDGLAYLKIRFPQDYNAINWINKNIKGRPLIVEAQGDSYTDYGRVSANTGLPTILGWTVHEWLWRGTYDIPAPRIQEITNIYESPDINLTKKLLKKYNAKYIIVGNLEHQKYPNLIEDKFNKLGKVVFEELGTKIYKLSI